MSLYPDASHQSLSRLTAGASPFHSGSHSTLKTKSALFIMQYWLDEPRATPLAC